MEQMIPGLPDDVALQCLIRIPCIFHGVLRCVSKSWNRLFSSESVQSRRAQENRMHGSLHIMVRDKAGNYLWYVLVHTSWRSLAPIPFPAIGGAVAADSKLYFIGGSHSGIASRSVWSYDPSFNRWSERSRMRVPREFAAAEFVNGKIYVLGGCPPGLWAGSRAWAEVYDPGTDNWSTIEAPPERRERWMHGSVTVDGKMIAVADTGGIVYDPSCNNSFACVSPVLNMGWGGSAAVLRGIIFSANSARIQGYDSKKNAWYRLVCKLPKMTSMPLLCAVDGKLYIIGEAPRKSKFSSELVVVAMDVKQGEEEFFGSVLWCKVAPCNAVVSAVIHAISVAV